jgi:hypothetical protein
LRHAVIIFPLWFYVAAMTFLLGGEINAEIEHAAHRDYPEAKAKGEKKTALERSESVGIVRNGDNRETVPEETDPREQR